MKHIISPSTSLGVPQKKKKQTPNHKTNEELVMGDDGWWLEWLENQWLLVMMHDEPITNEESDLLRIP